MRKIRIGNDINIEWKIMRNGMPESFDDKGILLILTTTNGDSVPIEKYAIDRGVIKFTLYGKDQTELGIYTLTLYENKGKEAMSVVDACEAFMLVPLSCHIGGQPTSDNLNIETLELESNFDIPRNGLSAYEIALQNGFIGTEEQWLDSLKGVKGDQGDAAIISDVDATINNSQGIPSVSVELGGTPQNRTFIFHFKNLKGDRGDGQMYIDSSLSTTSTNALQNKVVTSYINSLSRTKLNIETYDKEKKTFAAKNEIPDVSDFITTSVDNLTNYYLKSETYTQSQVNKLIEGVTSLTFKKVEVRPPVGIPNVIYLIPSETTTQGNIYDEWIYIDNLWENIGSTSANLENYYTITQTNEKFATKEENNNKVEKVLGEGLISNAEKERLSKVDNYDDTQIRQEIGDKQPKGNYALKDEIPTTLAQLTDDADHRLVTDAEKETWNNKSDFDGDYNSLTNRPEIPSGSSEEIEVNDTGEQPTTEGIKMYVDFSKTTPDLVVVPEAPQDGKSYIRRDGAWYQVDLALLTFMDGINAVTSLASLPIDKRSIVATVATATAISLSPGLKEGQDLYIRVVNNSDATITQLLPTDDTFTSMSGENIEIPSKGFVEISIWCYEVGKYSIRAGGLS